MNQYTLEYKIRNKDVDINKKLKTSRLFELLQEISITHTELLGAGREKTLDKGFLWVILQQRITINNLPEYDDNIKIVSWPGKTMHVLFPRYYRIYDDNENILVEGSTLWALIDINERKLIFPDKYGIEIEGEKEESIELPKGIKDYECEYSEDYKALYSYCDLNGHMNNTVYYSLADNIIKEDNFSYSVIQSEFKHEIPYKEEFALNWHKEDNLYYFRGNNADKECFRIIFEK